jgi:hypothetical protein
VVALRVADIAKRLFMVMQAFVDDSYKANGVYVLAGNIATPEKWASFSKDWEEMLPLAPIDEHGRRNFKMREMVLTPERRENLGAFYRVMEKHILCSFSFHFRINDLKAAKERVHFDDGTGKREKTPAAVVGFSGDGRGRNPVATFGRRV